MVVNQLDGLRSEWTKWMEEAKALARGPNSPDYDPKTCTEAIMDGFDKRDQHDILRERTLVFIGNNFEGYEFLFENWPTPPYESNTSRLSTIVPTWLKRLETLAAAIEYARVPDGFWKERGKQLVTKIANMAPDKAADAVAAVLKNPGV